MRKLAGAVVAFAVLALGCNGGGTTTGASDPCGGMCQATQACCTTSIPPHCYSPACLACCMP